MRVSLFTDTLGDVNGVSRFIQNAADAANRTGRDLHVLTSTRFPTPSWPNIFNFKPVFSARIPRYENLEVCLPPLVPMIQHLNRCRPDAVHVSTPGPVGLVGLFAARILRVPALGVYHTDFPAYVDRLFDDRALTWITRQGMRTFYRFFQSIFTRSDDYTESLAGMGLARARLRKLTPGVDTDAFHPRSEDRSIWTSHGLDPKTPKVIYVGRISIEKNLPLLSTAWRQLRPRLRSSGRSADLIIIGDGPYLRTMERELGGSDVAFLGFRHGEELSRLYASSDLFVFPSLTDTLGQVVMESQASGLPVIVADRGGPKEVVREGLTGLVLPPGPASVWADAILSLVLDPDRRRAMGTAAHRSMQAMSIEQSFEHFWRAHEDARRRASVERSMPEACRPVPAAQVGELP